MASIPSKKLSSLDGTATDSTWETVSSQRMSVVDFSNPRHPRHIILDSSGVAVTRPGQTPVHLPMSAILSAAITANPLLAAPPICTQSPASQAVKAGSQITLSASFNSPESAITGYQWYSTAPGSKSSSAVKYSTNSTLGITATESGVQYRCVAISLAGSTSSESATILISA